MIDTSMFPYPSFPTRLEYEDKSGKVICFFSCEEHLKKHMERYKLNKTKVVITRRPEDWIETQPLIISEPSSQPKKPKVATKKKPRKKKNV